MFASEGFHSASSASVTENRAAAYWHRLSQVVPVSTVASWILDPLKYKKQSSDDPSASGSGIGMSTIGPVLVGEAIGVRVVNGMDAVVRVGLEPGRPEYVLT